MWFELKYSRAIFGEAFLTGARAQPAILKCESPLPVPASLFHGRQIVSANRAFASGICLLAVENQGKI
jgi:hypothetical protein